MKRAGDMSYEENMQEFKDEMEPAKPTINQDCWLLSFA
jgi:hypothetical protein